MCQRNQIQAIIPFFMIAFILSLFVLGCRAENHAADDGASEEPVHCQAIDAWVGYYVSAIWV